MPELVKQDGGALYYDDQGPRDSPALVLIEGLSAHLLGWRDGFIQPFIQAGYRVIRFDNRDVGLSEHYPGQSYRVADMAEDVHELVAHLDIAPAHIVGQSMGGMIAQCLAVSHPEDLASLTLLYTAPSARHLLVDLSAHGLPGGQRATTREEAIQSHIARESLCASSTYSFDEEWKRTLGSLMWDRHYDPDGVERQAGAALGHDLDTRELRRISVPTLLVHGTSDQLISHAGSIDLAEAIEGSELVLIDGLGHDLPVELWPELTRLILTNAARATERWSAPA